MIFKDNFLYFKVVVSMIVLAGCQGRVTSEDRQKAEEAAVISRAQEEVKNLLKDPASAQFRNVAALSETAVCGEVNAKNGFGGYNGFTKFGYTKLYGAELANEQGRLDKNTICN